MLRKNLLTKGSNNAIQKANSILGIGKLKESTTVAIAKSKAAEKIVDYNRKRINNVKVYYI